MPVSLQVHHRVQRHDERGRMSKIPPNFNEQDLPATYQVKVQPVGDHLKVEARMLYCWEGKLFRSGVAWRGPHPSLVYVSEPGWIARLFGDTIEARIERAKVSVTRWAEREMVKDRSLSKFTETIVMR